MAAALTKLHLTRTNVLSFFKNIVPSNDSAIPNTNDEMPDLKQTINAMDIQQYMQKSGKVYTLEQIKAMMDECADQPGFNSEAEVDFDSFYLFLTSKISN